jgi:hypothetical protein
MDTFLDHPAALCVEQAQMAVFVPKIYPERCRWLPSATIHVRRQDLRDLLALGG